MAGTVKKGAPTTNGGPPAQRIIDLGKARAARAEAHNDPVVLRWDDETEFTLPPELPADFALLAFEGDLRGSIVALLGDEDAARFFALRPSMNDVTELAESAARVYGIEPGESPASAKS
jgi:hypothetical protein